MRMGLKDAKGKERGHSQDASESWELERWKRKKSASINAATETVEDE